MINEYNIRRSLNSCLHMVGDSAIVLPNSGVRVHIYHKDNNLKIAFYDEKLQLIYEEASFNGGSEAYYLNWSKNERYFALTYESQWYEDLYFIDINEKRIIYEITGHNMIDGSRSIAFCQNKALILPTLNFEGGISDFKMFNCETLEEEMILDSENAKLNGLVVEDSCVDATETYLFVRSNFYLQESLYETPSSIGESIENLFNLKHSDSIVRCFRIDKLVNDKIFEEVEIDTSALQDGKMISENTNNENGLIGKLHFIKAYQIKSIEIRKKPAKILLPLFPHKIEGSWRLGYSLDYHTLSSNYKSDGTFDTIRTTLGEYIYKLKYCFKKENISPLAISITKAINLLFSESVLGNMRVVNFDVILPIPPSNLERPFQPLIELTKEISILAGIPTEINYFIKQPTPELKGIDDLQIRKEVLTTAFSIADKRFKGKTVLLFDDLYRSGETLNAATKVLKEQGEVGEIYVLTITKTRTKK